MTEKTKKKGIIFKFRIFAAKKISFHNLYKFSGFAFFGKRKKPTENLFELILVITTYKLLYLQYLSYNLP